MDAEVRDYCDDDLPSVTRMWREVGWIEHDSERQAEALGRLLQYGAARVGVVAGDAECLVHRTPGTIRYDGVDLPLCAITAVTTSPIARNLGLASRMTAEAIAAGAIDGAAVAALGMFEQGFYDRFGMGTLAYVDHLLLRPGEAARRPAPAGARPCHPRRLDGGRRPHGPSGPAARQRQPRSARGAPGRAGLGRGSLPRVRVPWRRRSADGVHRRHQRRRARAVQGAAARLRGRRRPARPARPAAVARRAAAPGADGRARGDPAPGPHRPAHPGRGARRPRPPGVAHGRWRGTSSGSSTSRRASRRAPGRATRCPSTSSSPTRSARPTWTGRAWPATTRSRSVRRRPSSQGTGADLPVLRASIGALSRLWFGVRPATGLTVTDDLTGPPELLEALDRALVLPPPLPELSF